MNNTLLTVFMIVSITFSVIAITYVVVDITLEIISKLRAKAPEEPQPVPAPVVETIVELPPPPVVEEIPEIVEEITPEVADELMTNDTAMKGVIYETGAGHGKQGIVNIGYINDNYEAGEVVTIASLKEKKLVPKKVGRVKILAYGILSKPLTIKSESFSIQAMKMIELTGGTVVILKDE